MKENKIIKTYDELSKLHGKKITCKINGMSIEDAKICVEEESIFVCQNEKDGKKCIDNLGYKYSWLISGMDNYEVSNRVCTEIKLVEEGSPISDAEPTSTNITLNPPDEDISIAIIDDAGLVWGKFIASIDELKDIGRKIKSKKQLETLTKKIKEL